MHVALKAAATARRRSDYMHSCVCGGWKQCRVLTSFLPSPLPLQQQQQQQVARSEVSPTTQERFSQLVGFQVSTPPLRQQTEALAGASSYDSNGGEGMEQRYIGGSLHDGTAHSGVVFSAAGRAATQNFSTGSNAGGSVVGSLMTSMSMPSAPFPSPVAARPVSMLSRQIGKSLKRISNQLKRISASMSAAPSQQQSDGSRKGGKDDGSCRGRGKDDVSRMGGMADGSRKGGKKEDGSISKPSDRPEVPVTPALYLHPTAPLWQAGCEYEAASVAASEMHYPAPAPVPELHDPATPVPEPHYPSAARVPEPHDPAIAASVIASVASASVLHYPAPATAAIVDAATLSSSVEPAWLSPPKDRSAAMCDSARSPSFR